MIAVLFNTLTVIIGSVLGLLLKNGIKEKYKNAVMLSIGLCTVAIGISGIMDGENSLVLIISAVLGSILGTFFDLDGKINTFGDFLSRKFKKQDGKTTVAEGFVTACLLFCIGSMTIVGSLEAGINSDNSMLFTKSILDLCSSLVLASSLGIGVLFSAAFVLVFQGGLVLLASYLAPFLSAVVIAEISCCGGLMIFALGLNITGITKIKVANLLPSLLFIPAVCYLFTNFIKI